MSSPLSLQERRSFWQSHVRACEQSGISKAHYCREHQLEYHQLIYWYPKFSLHGQTADDGQERPRFLPVAIEQAALVSSLQIRLPNGVLIEGITEHSAGFIGALIRQLCERVYGI